MQASAQAVARSPLAGWRATRGKASRTPPGAGSRGFAGVGAPSNIIGRASRHPSAGRRLIIKAAIDPSTAVAALQQDLAFVALIAGEGFYTQSIVKEGTEGRPSVADFGPLCAGLAVASALLASQTSFLSPAGALLGLLASGACGLHYVNRFKATPGDPTEWPGPKAWPGAGAFVSFLAICTNLSCLTHIFK
mmetsp:Transcript_57357/g.181579  ORF Transcript_57357/g.181579 Transcript_57357/m.181579 type:complete len:192 (-) Transcript_57357:175-750(-)